eukprot:SAG31_NODE_181_length_21114_cov_99.705211_15_plen_86_part_00
MTALRVENMDVVPFTFQALLHTYYSIPAISEVTVSMVGMEGLHYYDKVCSGQMLATLVAILAATTYLSLHGAQTLTGPGHLGGAS